MSTRTVLRHSSSASGKEEHDGKPDDPDLHENAHRSIENADSEAAPRQVSDVIQISNENSTQYGDQNVRISKRK